MTSETPIPEATHGGNELVERSHNTPNPVLTRSTRAMATKRSKAASVWSVTKGEWIKFWSVRSTSFTLIAAGLVTVALGMIFSSVAGGAEEPGPAAGLTNPVDLALSGTALTQMIVGVLGVLVVAGEYSTGLIRTWFAAAGRRYRVVVAKVGVAAASILVMGAISATLALVLGQAVYAGDQPTVALIDATDVLVGNVVYLVGIGLIGVALGFLLRSTAAGIGVLVAGVFVGPNLLRLLPASITDVFFKYLPSEAGAAMMTSVPSPDQLNTGAAYAVFAAWVVGLLAAAGVMVNRRDA